MGGGESDPKSVKDVVAGGSRRGRHGLEVGPGGLLHQAVPDGDFVAGAGGRSGGGRVDGGRGREDVS